MSYSKDKSTSEESRFVRTNQTPQKRMEEAETAEPCLSDENPDLKNEQPWSYNDFSIAMPPKIRNNYKIYSVIHKGSYGCTVPLNVCVCSAITKGKQSNSNVYMFLDIVDTKDKSDLKQIHASIKSKFKQTVDSSVSFNNLEVEIQEEFETQENFMRICCELKRQFCKASDKFTDEIDLPVVTYVSEDTDNPVVLTNQRIVENGIDFLTDKTKSAAVVMFKTVSVSPNQVAKVKVVMRQVCLVSFLKSEHIDQAKQVKKHMTDSVCSSLAAELARRKRCIESIDSLTDSSTERVKIPRIGDNEIVLSPGAKRTDVAISSVGDFGSFQSRSEVDFDNFNENYSRDEYCSGSEFRRGRLYRSLDFTSTPFGEQQHVNKRNGYYGHAEHGRSRK